jgi:predicted HAD superfamily Cof-like phosphohydrolase
MMEGRIDFIEEVAEWNIVRDNLLYSPSLEYCMLDEELNEYMEAGIAGDEVAQADALADILVVAAGGLTKLCKGDIDKVQDILLIVTAANNLKPKDKVNGKIIKGDRYVAPESAIKEILNDY